MSSIQACPVRSIGFLGSSGVILPALDDEFLKKMGYSAIIAMLF
jgi:hypothetical protein